MQPCSREMQGGLNMSSLLNPQDLHPSHFDPISAAQSDHDFLDQMFSSISPTTCSWPDLNPADLSPTADTNGGATAFNHFDESALLASKLRQHQISSSSGSAAASSAATAKVMMLQQQMMMARGFDPLQGDVQGGEDSVQALFNGFGGSLHGGAPPSQHFPLPQGGIPSFGAQPHVAKSATAGSGSTTASGGTAATGANGQPRQRVRARRGQATDPHSIAERLRRERIAERMKALQELVPNANKGSSAIMLLPSSRPPAVADALVRYSAAAPYFHCSAAAAPVRCSAATSLAGFQPTSPCRRLQPATPEFLLPDSKLILNFGAIAQLELETRLMNKLMIVNFVKVMNKCRDTVYGLRAEKSSFLADKLKFRALPTLALIKNTKEDDYVLCSNP